MAYKRRLKILNHPKFQLLIIGINTLILLIYTGGVAIQLYRTKAYLREQGVQAGLHDAHPYFEFVAYQSQTLIEFVLWGCLISTVISGLVLLFVTNRMAGPLVRIKNHFQEIARTKTYKPLSLRPTDFLSDIVPDVNSGLEALDEKHKTARGA